MRLVIAGGGTGGHLFPGIAIAEELLTRQKGNEVLFVGTSRGIEARVVPQLGHRLELVDVSGVKGRGLAGWITGLFRIPRALLQARRILRDFRPDVVIGVGGYASFPVVLAAFLMGIPTAVQEQNALPGMTNRVLARVARAVFVSFPEARARFPSGKVHDVGNPIRRALLENFLRPQHRAARRRLLVFGGSQGARAINRAMAGAAGLLGELRAHLSILHQTGARDAADTRAAYAAAGAEAEVVEFIDDMSRAYAEADLIVCRAGATTIAELTVCHRAAILIPFPHAADNHQELNARSLVNGGAAVMILERELTPERLAGEIGRLIGQPEELQRMERAAGHLGRPEAAREIVDVCAELARGR